MNWKYLLSVPVVPICFLLAMAGSMACAQQSSLLRVNYSDSELKDGGTAISTYRGWDFLVEKLKADGVEEAIIDGIYRSEKMPLLTPVTFKLKPREPSSIYGGFVKAPAVKKAREFKAANMDLLAGAEVMFGVDRDVIAALLLVETHYGTNTGRDLVVERLSRIASIAEPKNIVHNYDRLRTEKGVTLTKVEQRAHELEELFYPEVKALIETARREQIDIFQIRGSSAGAFGIPQFLPTSYLKYGTDGNGDGVVSLFEMPDAVYSVGRFLSAFGWSKEASVQMKKKAIWHYNHSQPYVDAVYKLSQLLKIKPAAPAVKKAPRKVPAGSLVKTKGTKK